MKLIRRLSKDHKLRRYGLVTDGKVGGSGGVTYFMVKNFTTVSVLSRFNLKHLKRIDNSYKLMDHD